MAGTYLQSGQKSRTYLKQNVRSVISTKLLGFFLFVFAIINNTFSVVFFQHYNYDTHVQNIFTSVSIY